LFLVKGGLYLELQLGLKARTTKDVDTLFRGTAEEFERAVNAVLTEPWGPFKLERTALERVMKAPRLTKPYRFAVLLTLRGKTWRRVQVEVAFPEGNISSAMTPVPSPNVSFFGVEPPSEIVAIAMDYQVAQKLHAASDPDIPPDIINDRVRDVIDLALINDHFYRADPVPASLKAACLDVFTARAEEAIAIGKPPRHWPPTLVANSAWEQTYPKLAKSVELNLTLEEAISIVQEWVVAITNSQ
jgi:hypothetical protein